MRPKEWSLSVVRDHNGDDRTLPSLSADKRKGGINHTIDDTALGWLKTTPTMVVGMDVTHPSPGTIEGTPSVAAVVASVDSTFAQFPGKK